MNNTDTIIKSPADKAKELLWLYLPIIEGWKDDSKTELAKKCAIILVDQIIASGPTMPSKLKDTYWIAVESASKYWEDVILEIEKI